MQLYFQRIKSLLLSESTAVFYESQGSQAELMMMHAGFEWKSFVLGFGLTDEMS